MRAYFKPWMWIPFSTLVFACASSDSASQPASPEGDSAGAGTSAGSGSTTGSGSDIGTRPGSGSTTGTGPGTSGVTTGGVATGTGGSSGAGGAGGGPVIQPGILTAGVWDDNRNFSRFLTYRS